MLSLSLKMWRKKLLSYGLRKQGKKRGWRSAVYTECFNFDFRAFFAVTAVAHQYQIKNYKPCASWDESQLVKLILNWSTERQLPRSCLSLSDAKVTISVYQKMLWRHSGQQSMKKKNCRKHICAHLVNRQWFLTRVIFSNAPVK